MSANHDSTRQIALALMHEHGLHSWTFRFDNARQRCGACHFHSQEITLSKHFVEENDSAEIRATLLHEIAHALCGPGVGHGKKWRETAMRIGASGATTNNSANMPEPAWLLQCLSCESIVARRHRRVLNLTTARCRHCGVDDGILRWIAAAKRHRQA
jgi:predicted SprT family Zn-dependent metalloprotease